MRKIFSYTWMELFAKIVNCLKQIYFSQIIHHLSLTGFLIPVCNYKKSKNFYCYYLISYTNKLHSFDSHWIKIYFYFQVFRSICLEVFSKNSALKNSARLTGKYLRWNLFLIKLQV